MRLCLPTVLTKDCWVGPALLAGLIMLTACDPRIAPAGLPFRAPVLLADRAVMADGEQLPLRRWLPDRDAVAAVIALHGYTDYSNAFRPLGRHLAPRGVAVYAYDQRGFGATSPRGLWPGLETLVDDLRQVTGMVRRAHPATPLFLLGESVGAAVVMVLMAGPEAPGIRGVILVAPAVWDQRSVGPLYAGLSGLLWLLAHVAPGAKLPAAEVRALASDNRDMLEALERDPLVLNAVRADSVYGLLTLMNKALAGARRITAPTLVLLGANERLVPRRAQMELLRRLSAPHDAALYPRGYHALLRDLNAAVVLDDIAAWIRGPHAPLLSDCEIDRRSQAVGRAAGRRDAGHARC